jgi:hypothetical protein
MSLSDPDIEYLFYFHTDSFQVVEVKVHGLPQDSPPAAVYHWLTHDENSREIRRLSFVSMESEGDRQYRQFDEGELRFDLSRAWMTLTALPAEFELEVRNPTSVADELNSRVRAFLQTLTN